MTNEKIAKKYKYAVIAVDIVILTIKDDELNVFLIKMKKMPYSGFFALPGGLIRPDESLEDAARRHLFDKTGLKNIYLEQLYAFGKVRRDPFGRVVSVAYMALIPFSDIKQKIEGIEKDATWFSYKNLPKLAYDHKEIIKKAFDRLQSKLAYTTIVSSLLPREFTLSQLQKVYEIILAKQLDKRNFRKKLLSLGVIQRLRKKRAGGRSRPAELYRFKKSGLDAVDIL